MILKILKSNSPVIIFYYIVISILLWLFTFINYHDIVVGFDTYQMPFYKLLLRLLNPESILTLIFSLLMVIIQGLLLVRLNQKHIIINKRTYLPAIIFVIIVSSNISYQQINPMIFANLFLILIIDNIYSIYREDYILNKLYITGFYVAVASLFYFPYIFLFLLIWISLLIFKTFSGREWFVPILGLLTPYLFLFVYLFLVDDLNYLIEPLERNFNFDFALKSISFSNILFYSYLGLLILISSLSILRKLPNKKIKIRKYFKVNWWFFIIGISIFLFLDKVSYEIMYLLAIPSSFLITEYFYMIRSKIYADILFFLLFSGIVFIQISHFL